MAKFIEVENIVKRFGGVVALNGVSFSADVGEIVGLVGENGSGKSTMIKIISGIYRPDAGAIMINGKKYKYMTPLYAIRAGVSVIYQDFLLCPNLTVAENIAMNSWVYSGRRTVNWGKLYKDAEKSLKCITTSIDLKAEVAELSTAERQIVAIARSLFEGARLIIMDEPTSALTEKEVASLFAILRGLKEKNVGIMFVSHKLQEIKEIADKVVVLRDGQVAYEGLASAVDVETIQFYMTGQRTFTEKEAVAVLDKTRRAVLTVEDFTLEPYFYNVTFSLFEGEVLGITGLLGSGRRELALALVGALRPQSGRIFLHGKETRIASVTAAWESGIGYVPEDRISEGLILPQTITANVILPSIKRHGRWFFSYRRVIPVGQHWCQELEIKAPSSEAPVATLSGGNQQRVVLAKCLQSAPCILILNNPTMGIDVKTKAAVHSLIKQLAEKGIGIVVFSDDIPELRKVCDRILVLKGGRIAYEVQSYMIGNVVQLYEMLVGEWIP